MSKYKYSRRSKEKLSTCHDDLKTIMNELILHMDCSILCGHRSKIDQNKAYDAGNSKLRYPSSKHNVLLSKAVDVAPYPIDWKNIDRFKEMVDLIKDIAKEKGISIRCGADFKSFKDYPHIELKD